MGNADAPAGQSALSTLRDRSRSRKQKKGSPERAVPRHQRESLNGLFGRNPEVRNSALQTTGRKESPDSHANGRNRFGLPFFRPSLNRPQEGSRSCPKQKRERTRSLLSIEFLMNCRDQYQNAKKLLPCSSVVNFSFSSYSFYYEGSKNRKV